MQLLLAHKNDPLELAIQKILGDNYPRLEFIAYNEEYQKERRKSLILKAGYGATLIPFALLKDDDGDPIKAFYSEVGECTLDNIISSLNKYYFMKVKIINNSNFPLPEYATKLSAGLDVRANIQEPLTIEGGSRCLIPTGLRVAIPKGYEIQVRPRSGLAIKYGLTVLNSPGTIDSDFRGEIGVILINTSHESFILNPGERIGQLVLNKFERIDWEEVEELDETERKGGFGSTGVK